MARYTNLFMASGSIQGLRQALVQILQACDLNLVYETTDYLMAKEKPGQVSYAQLATVEVLINVQGRDMGAHINLIVKNEELPLNSNNHCQRIFDLISQAITETEGWQGA